MKKAITLLLMVIVISAVFSCRNNSVKTKNESVSLSGKATSETGAGNINSNGPSLKIQEDVNDIDGNVYKTVRIGNQTWMLKNLKTTKYNDGTLIPLITDSSAWKSLTTPGYCWYENELSTFKPLYGALYNWYTINTGKLCPKDWHVPGDGDWTIMTNYLGGEGNAGSSLKETGTSFWVTPNTGATNKSSFSALPGGLRYHDGSFHDFGFSGYWWSSTEISPERAFFRYMDYEYANVFRFENLKKIGFSVRCIRDY